MSQSTRVWDFAGQSVTETRTPFAATQEMPCHACGEPIAVGAPAVAVQLVGIVAGGSFLFPVHAACVEEPPA